MADVDDGGDAGGNQLALAGGDGDFDVGAVHALFVGDELEVVELQLLHQGNHFQGGLGQVVHHQDLGAVGNGGDAVGVALADGALGHEDAARFGHMALDLQRLALGGYQDHVGLDEILGLEALEEIIADFHAPVEYGSEIAAQDILQLGVARIGDQGNPFHDTSNWFHSQPLNRDCSRISMARITSAAICSALSRSVCTVQSAALA